jgi:hypothetical protein
MRATGSSRKLRPTTTFMVVVAFLFGFLAADARGNDKREVFIFYANETGCSQDELQNYKTVIGWLRSANHHKARTIAAQLETDLNSFPARVNAEIGTICDRLPKTSPNLSGVLFSNHLARSGKFLVLRAGAQAFEEASISLGDSDDPVLKSNPLSNRLAMRRAFREVANRFDPQHHDFILVTNSHGSPIMAVTPRLGVWHKHTNRDELLSVVRQELAEDDMPL